MKPGSATLPSILSSFSYKREDREKDVYINLRWSPSSKVSSSFIEKVISLVSLQGQWKYRPGESMRKAAGAYIFGLLSIPSLDSGIWLARPLGMPSFKGAYVGYKPFIRLHNGLVKAGFVEMKAGLYKRDVDVQDGIVTRLRPTPSFLAFAGKHGLTPANARQHFAPVKGFIPIHDPVRVRAATKGDYWNAEKGRLLPVDPTDAKAAASIARVRRLNDWFADVDFEGCTFEGFYRLFNLGDQDGFDFDKRGRLYAHGDYQRIEKERRRDIRIKGERVVEVDVSGSHLTIYHALVGAPLMLGFDPYDMPGIPREVVKSFVVMTLGNGKFQNRWSLPIAKEYAEKHGGRLQDAYPLAATREAILTCLPALRLLPKSSITWADLQYRESLGLLATVERLAFEYDVPALPLHDSVIVPLRYAALADRIMKECFWKEAGIRIGVKVKE